MLPDLLARGAQLALLGAGEKAIEKGFAAAALAHKGAVACVFGYDEALAHLMQAGSDFIVVPSRFEPCGLTQLCALRYGATPVVARVGGLADTIIDANDAAIGGRRRHRRPVLAGRRAVARLRARARARLVSRRRDDAAHAPQRHARGRLVARPRQALRRDLPRAG